MQLIYKNADRLTPFMKQWLSLRKIKNGQHALQYRTMDVIDYIKSIFRYFIVVPGSKNFGFSISPPVKELMVRIDPDLLDIILYDLLSRAYSFSSSNTLIEVVIFDDGSDTFSIEIIGSGVSGGRLEQRFRLDHPGSSPPSAWVKGTGSTLALVKEIVDLHSGKLTASGNLPLKLSLKATLPKNAFFETTEDIISWSGDGEITTAHRDEDMLKGQNDLLTAGSDRGRPLVLLVEGDAELRVWLEHEIGDAFEVVNANNGFDGLLIARKLLPDIILSDIIMPLMNGVEMLNKLKCCLHTSHIPVLMLNGKFSFETPTQGLLNGADHYLGKPYSRGNLLMSMENLINQRGNLFEMIIDPAGKTYPDQITITCRDEIFLKQVVKIVEENISNTEFCIERLANDLAMGSRTFFSKIRSLSCMDPGDFVRDMRLRKAKQLFDDGESRVYKVSFEVGFENPASFSRYFEKKYFVSPSAYLSSLSE